MCVCVCVCVCVQEGGGGDDRNADEPRGRVVLEVLVLII